MLKKHLRMRTKKKARRQKQPSSSSSTSSSSSSRPAADQQQTSSSTAAAAQQQQQQQQTSSRRPAAADLQQQQQQQEVEKWEGRCAQTTLYMYRGLQQNAAADATVSEKEACGLLVEKDTGAYAELTRGLRAGTHKKHLEFLMSDMEV